jgi:hypothetical protein
MRATLLAAALLVPAVALAGFGVSSHKKSSRGGDTAHAAGAALDGDLKTAWLVDPEQENKGSWIEVDVPASKVDKLSIVVGWAEDDERWADHARVKAARIEVLSLDGAEPKVVLQKDVVFEDKQDRQVVDLPDPAVGGEFSGGRVRLTVTDVYPGKDFANLAVSEFLVHLVEFDSLILHLDEEPSASGDGHPAMNLVDGNSKTFWESVGGGIGASFAVSSGRYSASSVGLLPGPTTHARPKTIEVSQTNVTRTYTVPDKAGWHWFELPPVVGYNGSGVGPVTVTVTEVYPGSKSGELAITDVKLKATVLDAF